MAHRAEKHDISELKLQGHGTGRKKPFQLIWWMQGNYSFPKLVLLPAPQGRNLSHFYCKSHSWETWDGITGGSLGYYLSWNNQRHRQDLAITTLLWIHFSSADPHCWVNTCALTLFNFNMFCTLLRAPSEFRMWVWCRTSLPAEGVRSGQFLG